MSTEEDRFLADRLALASLVSASLGGTAFAFRLSTLALPGTPPLTDPSFTSHAVGSALPLVTWALVRRVPLGRAGLHALDAATQWLVAIAYGVMGWGICRAVHQAGGRFPVDLIVILAEMSVTVSRAVFVPSTGLRTFVISSGNGLSLVIYAALSFRGDLVPPSPGMGVEMPWPALLSTDLMWWSITVILATLTSRTIYGLRREVKAARRLGQYVLEDRVGEGAMGVVYRARHAMLRRPTAVKLLRPERAGARAIARFEQEVQLTARLSHPNTVTVFDYGRTPDGVFYYAMELLDGATLDAVLKVGGPLPPSRVVHTLKQVAAALVEAHGEGLVHRDLKPSNIALAKQGGVRDVAKVLDFGLVSERGGAPLGKEGPITGTPLYLAPEAVGGEATAASDLYALGVVAFELLVGDVPYRGQTVLEVCAQHVDSPVVAPSTRARQPIPEALDRVVVRCLAKSPDDRPSSAAELLAMLEATGVPPHTQADAEAWWREHGDAIAAARSAGSPDAPALAVDWTRR